MLWGTPKTKVEVVVVQQPSSVGEQAVQELARQQQQVAQELRNIHVQLQGKPKTDNEGLVKELFREIDKRFDYKISDMGFPVQFVKDRSDDTYGQLYQRLIYALLLPDLHAVERQEIAGYLILHEVLKTDVVPERALRDWVKADKERNLVAIRKVLAFISGYTVTSPTLENFAHVCEKLLAYCDA